MKIGRMLDSGLMACSISETAEMKLREAWVIMDQKKADVNVVYGCGGLRVKQKSAFDVEMEAYGCKMLAPTLVVSEKHDELILGINVIKHNLSLSYVGTMGDSV